MHRPMEKQLQQQQNLVLSMAVSFRLEREPGLGRFLPCRSRYECFRRQRTVSRDANPPQRYNANLLVTCRSIHSDCYAVQHGSARPMGRKLLARRLGSAILPASSPRRSRQSQFLVPMSLHFVLCFTPSPTISNDKVFRSKNQQRPRRRTAQPRSYRQQPEEES
jgi:hypothetical protein